MAEYAYYGKQLVEKGISEEQFDEMSETEQDTLVATLPLVD